MVWIGFVAVFEKGDIVGEGIIDTLDAEYEKIGTRVVDDKVFKKLSKQAREIGGDPVENMTILYNEYILNQYAEKVWSSLNTFVKRGKMKTIAYKLNTIA